MHRSGSGFPGSDCMAFRDAPEAILKPNGREAPVGVAIEELS